MTIKRTLVSPQDVKDNSTVKLTQASNGILSGTFGIFWPLTADGTFGASISTKVIGFEYILTDGSTNQIDTINGTPKAGITVTVVGDDTQNHQRIIKVANTGTLGIVQINVVQEDLPAYMMVSESVWKDQVEFRLNALENPVTP